MSQACCNNCGCPTPEIVTVPGTSGINAYTTSSSTIILPTAGSNVAVATDVGDSTWMAIGQYIFGGDGAGKATFQVVSKASSTSVQLKFLGNPQDSAAGTVLAIGTVLSPSGQFLFGTLPSALSDNTTGAATSSLAAGVGVQTIALFVNLAEISATNADFLTTYTLGFKFKILAVSFAVEKAVTTAAKLATITPSISGVNVTGGVLALTSANCTPRGAVVSGTAVAGLNTGGASATISLTTSAVTAFSEGSGWVLLRVQNMDVADAFASIAANNNAIIAAL